MGTKDVQVEEIYSLDDLSSFPPNEIYGLVFLFNLKQHKSNPTVDTNPPANLFFAHQVINNACATQAILSILMNAQGIDLGPTLLEFKQFTSELPSDMRGLAISNSEKLRIVHNSFTHPEIFAQESRKATKNDDLFHFISYIPFQGQLYELDGLQEGPIPHGKVTNNNWLECIKPVIAQRMESYMGAEIRFNLMAVVKDPRADLEKQLAVEKNPDVLSNIKYRLAIENEKVLKMRKENARRRHNFIPLIFKLLEGMAEKGTLKTT